MQTPVIITAETAKSSSATLKGRGVVTAVVLGREEGEEEVFVVLSTSSSSSSAAAAASVVAGVLDVEETGVLLLGRIRREFLLVL